MSTATMCVGAPEPSDQPSLNGRPPAQHSSKRMQPPLTQQPSLTRKTAFNHPPLSGGKAPAILAQRSNSLSSRMKQSASRSPQPSSRLSSFRLRPPSFRPSSSRATAEETEAKRKAALQYCLEQKEFGKALDLALKGERREVITALRIEEERRERLQNFIKTYNYRKAMETAQSPEERDMVRKAEDRHVEEKRALERKAKRALVVTMVPLARTFAFSPVLNDMEWTLEYLKGTLSANHLLTFQAGVPLLFFAATGLAARNLVPLTSVLGFLDEDAWPYSDRFVATCGLSIFMCLVDILGTFCDLQERYRRRFNESKAEEIIGAIPDRARRIVDKQYVLSTLVRRLSTLLSLRDDEPSGLKWELMRGDRRDGSEIQFAQPPFVNEMAQQLRVELKLRARDIQSELTNVLAELAKGENLIEPTQQEMLGAREKKLRRLREKAGGGELSHDDLVAAAHEELASRGRDQQQKSDQQRSDAWLEDHQKLKESLKDESLKDDRKQQIEDRMKERIKEEIEKLYRRCCGKAEIENARLSGALRDKLTVGGATASKSMLTKTLKFTSAEWQRLKVLQEPKWGNYVRVDFGYYQPVATRFEKPDVRRPSGRQWVSVGKKEPPSGEQLDKSNLLARALHGKGRRAAFTDREYKSFGVKYAVSPVRTQVHRDVSSWT